MIGRGEGQLCNSGARLGSRGGRGNPLFNSLPILPDHHSSAWLPSYLLFKVEVFRAGSNFTVPGYTMSARKSVSSSSNRLAGLVLTLHALYLFMDKTNGSELLEVRGPWGPLLGLMDGLAGGRQGQGFRGDNGFHDHLLAHRNGYDLGKVYAGGQEYGTGASVGGGWRDVDGRQKGHTAAGFSTSYRKDESGDKSSYYDDGLGHHDKHKYGVIDQRFKEVGGGGRRGGYHDSNLNRGSLWTKGKYGDWHGQGYGQGYGGYGQGYGGGYGQGYGGYGHGHGHGHGQGYGGYGGYGWRRARFFTLPPL